MRVDSGSVTIPQLATRYALPIEEVERLIVNVSHTCVQRGKYKEFYYPLNECSELISFSLSLDPKPKTLKTVAKMCRLSTNDTIEICKALGASSFMCDLTMLPYKTFLYVLSKAVERGAIEKDIVNVAHLSEKYQLKPKEVAEKLARFSTPLAVECSDYWYRFFPTICAERVLKEKHKPVVDSECRTLHFILKEFKITREQLASVISEVFPTKKWTLNKRMSEQNFELLRHSIINRKFLKRRAHASINS